MTSGEAGGMSGVNRSKRLRDQMLPFVSQAARSEDFQPPPTTSRDVCLNRNHAVEKGALVSAEDLFSGLQ